MDYICTLNEAIWSTEYIVEGMDRENIPYCYGDGYTWLAEVNHGIAAFNSQGVSIERLENAFHDIQKKDMDICGSNRHIGPIGFSGESRAWFWAECDVWSSIYVDDEGRTFRYATQIGSFDHDEYWFSSMRPEKLWIKRWYAEKQENKNMISKIRKWAETHDLIFEIIDRDDRDDNDCYYDWELQYEDSLIEYWEHRI